MSESPNAANLLKGICSRISTIKTNGENCGLALYNELNSVDYLFTESDLWLVADSLGYTEDIFSAIICTKLISSQTMLYLLKFVSFNVNLCWLALHCDNSDLLRRKVIEAVQRRGIFHYRALLNLLNRSPFDDTLKIYTINHQMKTAARCYYA